MNDNIKISVIVPVYNAEKHLVACIDSILGQTFSDFELLLINDGSIDESGKICDSYTAKHSRIKVFHKENGGVSSARNLGIENAKGKSICFVDSDDYLDKSYLQSLLNELENDVEFVIQSLSKFRESDHKINIYSLPNAKISIEEFLNTHKIYVYGYLFGKLFSRKVITNNNLLFDNKISFGEDCVFVITYLQYVNSLYLSRTDKYYYRETGDGLSKKTGKLEEEHYLFTTLSNTIKRLYLIHKLQYTEENMIAYNIRFLRAIYFNKIIGASERCMLLKKYKKEFIVCFDRHNKSAFLLATLLKLNLFSVFDFFYQQVTFKNG